MTSKFGASVIAIGLILTSIGCGGGGGGTDSSSGVPPAVVSEQSNWIHHWNHIAIDATGLDHTDKLRYGNQLGPTKSSRAMAIIHIAMFDAVNSILGGYESYTGISRAPEGASVKAAISQAAHDTLVALFPAQASIFDNSLNEDLAAIEEGQSKEDGIGTGKTAALAILSLRANDGSELSDGNEEYASGENPGEWRPDPINPNQKPLGPKWGLVRPFVLASASQFRIPPPPALTSDEYAAAYAEVYRLGGDGAITPTERTEDQTEAGIFWAYDGTPSLCAPPRLYNQIAVQLGDQLGLDVLEFARFLAVVNTALADAGIASWESKYYYNFWRPITGIRESDVGTGPTGLGDGNALTPGDPSYVPLCAPASNLAGPNFTPPFPSYPSGHAVFGGTLFQVLRRYFGTDKVPFTLVSDEFNGSTVDHDGNVRPLRPRSFQSLSQAEEENGQSRIYLGIHWSFDKVQGIAQGNNVGNFVVDNAFRPVK